MHEQDSDRVIETAQLGEYFHDAVQTTAGRHHLSADDATLHYVASLLCQYARSERVFDFAEQRLQLRPLALLYGEAMGAQGRHERCLWLQRLGDLALFVGGLFSGRLSRHFQDLDYCVAMGGNAYGYLQQLGDGRRTEGFLQHHVAAFRAEGDLHCIGQNVDALEHALTGIVGKLDFFCTHFCLPEFNIV